jgi:TolA-binding protein
LTEFADGTLASEVKMRKAETVLRQGDAAAAERLFAEVATFTDFRDVDHARYRQAFCVARQERFAESAELFASLATELPESRYATDATMAAARAYFRAEQLDQAVVWFDKLLGRDDAYATESAHWKSRVLIQQKAPPEALSLVEKYLPLALEKQHPFLVNLRMDQADAMYELEARREEAMGLYVKLAEEFPNHLLAPQALYNAAFAALELKQYPRGVELATQFVQRYPDHRLLPDVKHVVAECQLQLGDSDAAASTFHELARQNENRPEAGQWQMREAIALYMQKKYDEALQQFSSNVDRLTTPDEQAEAYYWIGMSQYNLQQFPAAQQSLAKSLEIQPKWRQADETLLQLGRVQRKNNDISAARATIQKLLEQFPETKVRDQALFRAAEFAYAALDYPVAATQYQDVLKSYPESTFAPYASYGLGWSLLRSNQHQPAAEAFAGLLKSHPDHPLAAQSQYARAMALQQHGAYDAALTELTSYLKRDALGARERSDARYVQGLSLVGKKQYPPAIEVLGAILAEDPTYAAIDKVIYELAWSYKSTDQPAEALQTFAKLAQEHSDSTLAAEAFYHLGEAAYDEQKYPEAIKNYQQARERLKDSPDLGEKVRYKLGWSHYQAEQYSEADGVFAEQVQKHPEGDLAGDAYFMRGECFLKQENFAAALEQYALAKQRPLSSEQIKTLNYLHAGQAAGQLEKWQESYDWLSQLAREIPNSPYTLQVGYELGVAQQKLGNLPEAERLFGSIADRAGGDLSAKARFMLGEVLYAKKDYVSAIREFRKVMFGFDPKVVPGVERWQSKAAFEAGQCAAIVASQTQQRRERSQYIELATRFFQFVTTRYPNSDEAKAAAEQLARLGQ